MYKTKSINPIIGARLADKRLIENKLRRDTFRSDSKETIKFSFAIRLVNKAQLTNK